MTWDRKKYLLGYAIAMIGLCDSGTQVIAQQTDASIEAIRAVGPKGKGNPAASSAWKDLVS